MASGPSSAAAASLLSLVHSSAGSSCGEPGASLLEGLSGQGPWQEFPFHRIKGVKMRKFCLLNLGCTATTNACDCELCALTSTSEDPLYPGHEIEWAYYKREDKQNDLSPMTPYARRCFYSTLAHRYRFKAWTSAELAEEMRTDDELRDVFMKVQNEIISQKLAGRIDIDISLLPVPRTKVETVKHSFVETEKPEEEILTEKAFKKRNKMTFKDMRYYINII